MFREVNPIFFYHFSEDPNILSFIPRKPQSYPDMKPCVWAIDEWHAPLYLFPRDCPRVAFWKDINSTKEDVDRFILPSEAKMIINVESGWLDEIRTSKLFRYTFSSDSFTCIDENAGYYTSPVKVDPIHVEPVGDLLDCLVAHDVELRITPNLLPLQNRILTTTLNFSMIRMRNANMRKK